MVRFSALLVVGALFLSACVTALPVYEGSSDEARDREQMLASMNASVDSWNRGDLKGHLAMYDESVTMMTKDGPRPTVAAIETAFRAKYFLGDKPKQSLRMEHLVIRSLSRDSALMTGRFVLSGGSDPELSGWYSVIWVRTASGWKVVHDHTS
jgi:ketosteroid isomerase-like protein